MARDFDVVIAGGGMVGASLALMLSVHSGGRLNIALVERFPLKPAPDTGSIPYTPSFDARSTALSQGSRSLLEPLGVWPALAQHLCAIDRIHVSRQRGVGTMTMQPEQVGWPHLGYVVENSWLGQVLLQALGQGDRVELLSPASVEQIVPVADGARLDLSVDGETRCCHSQLVVVADGAGSSLRRQLGIGMRERAYGQSALIANVSFSQPHRGCAFERFTRQGPLALLPLPDSPDGQPRAALVWTLPEDEVEDWLAADEASFLQQLQTRFGHRLGRFQRVGERFAYPLLLTEAEEQVRSGIVIMGNAAHSLHPVAGQGFNLALRDVARLSQWLVPAHRQHQSLGALPLLQHYQQSQAPDQQRTTVFSDRLPGLFSADSPVPGLLTGLGLAALDGLAPLKRTFIRYAAGMHDGAPLP